MFDRVATSQNIAIPLFFAWYKHKIFSEVFQKHLSMAENVSAVYRNFEVLYNANTIHLFADTMFKL